METAPLFERDRRPRARFVLPFALLAACALGAATLRGSERRAVVGELASEHHHHHSSHKGDDDDASSSSSSSSSSAAEGEGGSDDRMASTADVVKSANASRPHIIISLIDDQGFADMGYANEFDVLGDCTPYMDSLAADGIKLEWYYSQQLCTPSRASLLTGYYPIHLGMQHDVIQPESKFGLPLGHKLLPAYLKDLLGYQTHMVGKWHLGHYTKDYLPQNRGFDNFFGYLSDQLWYYNHKSPHACANGVCFYDMQHNGMNAEDAIGVYSTFLFTDVITQIFEHSDAADPMMMYISWQNVHAPLDPPPMDFFAAAELEVLAKIDDPHRRDFASMTIILDNAMKKIVGDAKAHGFYDDAILVVASDNGGCPYSGGYNYPLRGAKQYLFEGGIRVNAFVHSPNLIPDHARGRHYEGMVHVSDWLPTLLYGVADVSPDALDRALDGVDHWKHMVSPELFASADKYPRQEILHNIDLWSLDTQFHNVSLLETPVAGDDAEALSLSRR